MNNVTDSVTLSPFTYRILPWIAAVAFLMQMLDTSILNTALPTIAKDLNESPLNMQSAVISYALTLALFIPVSGFLADRFGTKIIFVVAVFLFTLGSLLCALSNTLLFLDLSRVIQGIGGAMMVPVSRLILIKSFKRSDFLAALTTSTTPGLIGPVIGPVLGGYLVVAMSWHWIFLINLPIGILGMIVGWKYLPNLKEKKAKFDFIGFICIATVCVTATLGLEFLSEENNRYLSMNLAIICAIFFTIYYGYAKHAVSPLFPLSLFRIRTFKIGILGNLLSRLGISSMPFLIPLLLQVVFGYSAIVAGMLMIPMAIASLMMKVFVGKILGQFGYKKVLIANTLLSGIAIFLLSQFNLSSSIFVLCVLLFCIGAMSALQFTSMNSITVADLQDEKTSSGNSLMAVNQQLAITFAIAIGAVLVKLIGNHTSTIHAFHITFMVLGVATVFSSFVFMRLKKEDGQNLTIHNRKRR